MERPALAPSVKLIGKFDGSNSEGGPWLISRDGRFVQVSELLYRIIEQSDGHRSIEEIAAAVTRSTDWSVASEDVRRVIESKLVPLGIVQGTRSGPGEEVEGGAGEGPHRVTRTVERSPFALHLRMRLLGPRSVQWFAGPLRVLFSPLLAIPLLLVAALAHGWVYAVRGASTGVTEVFRQPSLFLAVIGILVLGGFVHEIGHAAALAYGGGRSGGIGTGFYLVYPAFYTDVSDAYRLSRKDRLRVDLGGPYFHLLAALMVIGVALWTDAEFLLLVVVLIDVEIFRQLLPFLRLDGYWLLTDLTGIPDLFGQGKQLLWPAKNRSASELGRTTRRIVTIYMGLTVVLLPLLLGFGLLRLPGIVGQAWGALRRQASSLVREVSLGEVMDSAASLVQVFLLAVQLLGVGVFLFFLGVRPLWRAWTWTGNQPVIARRLLRAALAVAVGGTLLILGALYPWRQPGPLLPGGIPGTGDPIGWFVLAVGVVVIVGAVGAVRVHPDWLRRAIAVGLVGLGLLVSGIAVKSFLDSRTLMDETIRQSIRRTTGREASAAEVQQLEQVARALGVTVRPGYGVFVVTAGGALAAIGGFAAAWARLGPSGTDRSAIRGVPTPTKGF